MTIFMLATILLYCLLSITGLYIIKQSEQILSFSFAFGFTLYLLGFGTWMYLLRRYPLSVVFPLCSTALLIGTQLVGWFLLAESISLNGVIAVFLASVSAVLISTELKSSS